MLPVSHHNKGLRDLGNTRKFTACLTVKMPRIPRTLLTFESQSEDSSRLSFGRAEAEGLGFPPNLSVDRRPSCESYPEPFTALAGGSARIHKETLQKETHGCKKREPRLQGPKDLLKPQIARPYPIIERSETNANWGGNGFVRKMGLPKLPSAPSTSKHRSIKERGAYLGDQSACLARKRAATSEFLSRRIPFEQYHIQEDYQSKDSSENFLLDALEQKFQQLASESNQLALDVRSLVPHYTDYKPPASALQRLGAYNKSPDVSAILSSHNCESDQEQRTNGTARKHEVAECLVLKHEAAAFVFRNHRGLTSHLGSESSNGDPMDPGYPRKKTMPQRSSVANGDLSNTIDPIILGGLNLQPSPRLTYPDLALSSFATQQEVPPSSGLGIALPENVRCGAENHGKGNTSRAFADENTSEQKIFLSPLGFHIPADKMQAALDAEPESVPSYWQYSLYRGPDGKNQSVKVHYCKSKETMESVSQMFVGEKILGFDIEWMAQAKAIDEVKRNVSLIQIASEERIALFHIARFPRASVAADYVAPTFRKIMESSSITKVGVAIKGDSTRLRKFLNIDCNGLFELSYLYKLIKYYPNDMAQINKMSVSLSQQVKEHLQLPLLKGAVQTSDWSKDLDYDQARCEQVESIEVLLIDLLQTLPATLMLDSSSTIAWRPREWRCIRFLHAQLMLS